MNGSEDQNQHQATRGKAESWGKFHQNRGAKICRPRNKNSGTRRLHSENDNENAILERSQKKWEENSAETTNHETSLKKIHMQNMTRKKKPNLEELGLQMVLIGKHGLYLVA